MIRIEKMETKGSIKIIEVITISKKNKLKTTEFQLSRDSNQLDKIPFKLN